MADQNFIGSRALRWPGSLRGRRAHGDTILPRDTKPLFHSFIGLSVCLVVAAGGLTGGNAEAEEPEGIVIGGKTGSPSTIGRCVEVEIGGSEAFHCLNQELRRQVDRVSPMFNTPPIDAASPDVKTGVVNIPAVREQYGKNFGTSVIPYRPPPPTYTSPLYSRSPVLGR